MIHDWCWISQFCTRCGVGRDEFVNWKAPCFPTPAGAAFTLKMQRSGEAFFEQVFDEMQRLA